RDVRVHEADLPRLLDDVLREGAVAVVVPGLRPDLLLGEVVSEVADVLLLVGQVEVDHGGLLGTRMAPCGATRLIRQSMEVHPDYSRKRRAAYIPAPSARTVRTNSP